MTPLADLLSEAVARLKFLRERQLANEPRTGVPLGDCVRPGHPATCDADEKVGCVRWREAPLRDPEII